MRIVVAFALVFGPVLLLHFATVRNMRRRFI
jgi:hypothetical protein